jgi:ABC-type sugar transport system permease subunit/ABC-type glycerol-3-phosphate transport system substrate-binding protein
LRRSSAPVRALPARGLPALLLVIAVALGFPARTVRAEDTTLTVFAQAYTPEIKTGDNPKPLHEFTRIGEAFEKLHPGVKVKFIKSPVGDFRTWMRTQLQGGMAPDIMWTHSTYANEDAKYGWFENLDPYLAQPNPYVPKGQRGSVRWLDAFYPDATNAKRSPDGHIFSLPIDQVETAIFYNKDIFKKVGIEPPKTWAEFLQIQEKLRAAGIIPFLMTVKEPMRLQWTQRILNDQLWYDQLPRLDTRTTRGIGFPGVDTQEFISACKRGVFSVRNPRNRELLRLLKDWSRYWQKGFLVANDDRLFRLGKAAMWWDGSWYTPVISRDPLRSFDWGLFLVPPLTKQSSRFTSPVGSRGVGGASSIQYAITNSAKAANKVDLCVDFLRFVTAPQNLGPLVTEAELFVPNVIGLKGSKLLDPYLTLLEKGATHFGLEDAGPRYGEQQFRVLQAFLGGELTEDQAIDRLERYLAVGVEQMLKDNAHVWRFDDQWRILPPATAASAPDPESKSAPPTPAPAESHPPNLLAPAVILGAVGLIALLVLAVAFTQRNVRRHRVSYLFIAPTFLLLILFSYYPIFSALGHSFTEWKGGGQSTWVGLANFRELRHDDILIQGVDNMLRLLVAHMLISLTAPLLAAELIFALRNVRSQYLYRVLFVIPMVVPGVVILLIWGFIYEDNLGLLNQALSLMGLDGLRQSWLGDPNMALYSLMFMGFPWVGGFALLIYYAGLQNISADVFDSARLDGAMGLRRFRFIDLPLLMGQVKLLVVLGFIGGLQGFQTQLLLTNGGPGYATMVPGLHMYQNAISFDRMGYACAIGVVLFFVILGITYINVKYLRSSTEYQP